jgi:UV DNA damage repair endonuclease
MGQPTEIASFISGQVEELIVSYKTVPGASVLLTRVEAYQLSRRTREAAMLERDRDYYARRASAELNQAEQATVPRVVQVHHQLAKAYLDRIEADARVSSEPRP